MAVDSSIFSCRAMCLTTLNNSSGKRTVFDTDAVQSPPLSSFCTPYTFRERTWTTKPDTSLFLPHHAPAHLYLQNSVVWNFDLSFR
jgi:hypothetical protein